MNAETPATLRRKEAIASRNGAHSLAASYHRERVELECELTEPPHEITCPVCHGNGETEADTYRLDEYGKATRWQACRECGGEGTVSKLEEV